MFSIRRFRYSADGKKLGRYGRFLVVAGCTLLLLVQAGSTVRAQETVTPTPTSTATSTIDSAYPPPGPTEPYYTWTPNTYPGPDGSPTSVPSSIPATNTTPVPTSGVATLTPALVSTPGLPTLDLAGPTPALTFAAPVITTTVDLTATTTLMPLPELTLIFPTPRPAALLVTATPDPAQPSTPWTQPQRLVPLALVVLIWVILAAWFYYSQRGF